MAGRNSGFNAREFRTAIRFVYDMAAPPIEGERAIFWFDSQLVYAAPVDGEDVPFDPQATVTRIPARRVTDVPCGIEYQDANGEEIVFGTVTPSKLVIRFLDQDYLKVKGCNYVTIGPDKYLYKRTEPPSGLFDVGLYAMHFGAENDT
jgi:hypothetical protein